MYSLLRYFLFQLDPEFSHTVSLRSLRWLHRCGLTHSLEKNLQLPRTVMGIPFPNPVGLAAGLDKNAEYIDSLASLGFGFIEVGTVTPRPQSGNPKPRLFRLPQAEALINRLGFNNKGVDFLVEQVRRRQFTGVLGINIGKNAQTPPEQANEDYLFCLRRVYPVADYITINLSSPNTLNLRELQHGEQREALLASLKSEQAVLTNAQGKYVPLVVKVAPDLSVEQIHDIAESLLRHQIDGLIATNTAVSREGVQGLPHADEVGGLSGRPLCDQATRVVKIFHGCLQNKIPIIAAGGILCAEDARAKIAAGASLVQIYTGLIYRGPRLVKEIITAL